jgi:hypothetical protein
MVRHTSTYFLPPFANFDKALALRRPDAIDASARKLSFIGHVE